MKLGPPRNKRRTGEFSEVGSFQQRKINWRIQSRWVLPNSKLQLKSSVKLGPSKNETLTGEFTEVGSL